MIGAPPLVHSLLSELSYVTWLLVRGDLATARHHAAEAERKVDQVGVLLRKLQCLEARSWSQDLQIKSRELREKTRELLLLSDGLLTKSFALHHQAQFLLSQRQRRSAVAS